MLTSQDIRERFLQFFKQRGHTILPSASLVPENDPTTLFTGSGMQPMIPYLLGEKHPTSARLANSQRCFRTQDIEEVGDNRHTTFFEMLGNWSLGDYFKQEQISMIWEFLTKEMGLDPKHLYFSCFRGNEKLGIPKDTESAAVWQRLFQEAGIKDAQIGEDSEKNGMQAGERIFYYAEEKNWWSRSGVPEHMPIGEPGGPDTEMFWDFGAELKLHEQSLWENKPCHVNCDCGRFLEIGNNVFMEYKKTADGFEKLSQQNVDFGGGLERMTAAVMNDADIFKIDVFVPIFDKLNQHYGWEYESVSESEKRRMRIIADHVRSAVFLIADGIIPSNTDRGYFLRRLLRRAIYTSSKIVKGYSNLYPLTDVVVDTYKTTYPYLDDQRKHIHQVFEEEEMKFMKTLEKGEKEFGRLAEKGNIVGVDAFILFTTHGFPFELLQEIAQEKGLSVDESGFQQEMQKHQDLSRKGSEQKFKGGLADHSAKVTAFHTATHLMLAALRKELGDGVHQAGSNITEERTRFDFTYPEKVSRDILDRVEAYVNAAIEAGAAITTVVMGKEEARAAGVEGSFWEKYPDKVTVYQVEGPDGTVYSRELCGGPHVANTRDIITFGRFKIVKEEACSAGIRRIKAIFE